MRIFFVDTQKSFVGKGFPPCLRVFFLTEFLQQIFGYIVSNLLCVVENKQSSIVLLFMFFCLLHARVKGPTILSRYCFYLVGAVIVMSPLEVTITAPTK